MSNVSNKCFIFYVVENSVFINVFITARTVVQAVVLATGEVSGRGRVSNPIHTLQQNEWWWYRWW